MDSRTETRIVAFNNLRVSDNFKFFSTSMTPLTSQINPILDQLLSGRQPRKTSSLEHIKLNEEYDISKSLRTMLQNFPQESAFGFLTKKGKGESLFGRKNWKNRWFLLKGSRLLYYRTPQSFQTGEECLGEIILSPDVVVECLKDESGDNKNPFQFQVVTQHRTLRMSAASEEERQAWINQINLHKTMRRRTLPFL